MKAYNGSTRTMLKVGKKTSSIFNAMAEKTKAAFEEDLKTRAHKFSVTLNDPKEDVGTEIEYAIHACGSHYNEFKVRMNQYEGTTDLDKFMELTGADADEILPLKIEIVLGKFNNADALCDELEEKVESMMNEIKMGENSLADIMMPKFHQKEGKIICGLQIPVPKEEFGSMVYNPSIASLKIPYEI
jgi:hypothetical protein